MSHKRTISKLASCALVLVALGCQADRSDTALPVDTMLNRDIALTQQNQRPVELNDVPVVAAPRKAAPVRQAPRNPATQTPTPPRTVEPVVIPIPTPAASPTTGTILAGSTALASINSRVCTAAKAGDQIVAQLSEAMHGSNGVSIPAGATVVLEVTSATAMSDSSKGNIAFRVRSIEANGKAYQVVASARPDSALVKTRTTETKSDVKKVAAGAVLGGILGQILGKDTKGTVIGAAAGAAAGTAVAVATGNFEGCINEKGNVRITLTEAAIIAIG